MGKYLKILLLVTLACISSTPLFAKQATSSANTPATGFESLTLAASGARSGFSDVMQIQANGFATEIQTGRGATGAIVAAGHLSTKQMTAVRSAVKAWHASTQTSGKTACTPRPPIPDAPRHRIVLVASGHRQVLPESCSRAWHNLRFAIINVVRSPSLGTATPLPFDLLALHIDPFHRIEFRGDRTALEIDRTKQGTYHLRAGYLSDADMQRIHRNIQAMLVMKANKGSCKASRSTPYDNQTAVLLVDESRRRSKAWVAADCQQNRAWKALEKTILKIAAAKLKPVG